MIWFLVFCSCISSIDCLNCSDVVVDREYQRLSIYNNFWRYFYIIRDQIKGFDPIFGGTPVWTNCQQNWMFNRQGLQWSFNFSLNPDKEATVHLLDVGVRGTDCLTSNLLTIDEEVELKFAMEFKSGDEYRTYLWVNCSRMKAESNEPDLQCHFFVLQINKPVNPTLVNHTLNFTDNAVILKPFPSVLKYPKGSYVLAVNRDNKNEKIKIDFTPDLMIRTEICDQQCPNIAFIDQMDDQLFKGFDSAVEFRNSSLSGHLLLFNINNKPFYCFQPEGQPLSRQVLQTIDSITHLLSNYSLLIVFVEKEYETTVRALPSF